MDMSDMPNLARSLHSSRKLTPAQIRNQTGFLDSNDRPFIALETIQGWLADTQAPRTQSEARPSTASISDQPKPILMAAMPHSSKHWRCARGARVAAAGRTGTARAH